MRTDRLFLQCCKNFPPVSDTINLYFVLLFDLIIYLQVTGQPSVLYYAASILQVRCFSLSLILSIALIL